MPERREMFGRRQRGRNKITGAGLIRGPKPGLENGCTGRPWPEYRAGYGPGLVLADAETGSYRNCGILPWRLSPQCNRWEYRVRSALSLHEIMPVAVCIGTLSATVLPGRSGKESDRLRNPAK